MRRYKTGNMQHFPRQLAMQSSILCSFVKQIDKKKEKKFACSLGLVLSNIHNYMKIDREEVIDRLAVKYPKKLRMINMLEED